MNIKSLRAFTLVEILSVIIIISFLLAIAIPAYLKSRNTSRKTICITNLEKIDSMVSQWALEKHVAAGTAVSGSDEEDIFNNYIKDGKPRCPSGGEYTIHAVGDIPQVSCSKEDEGHKLP